MLSSVFKDNAPFRTALSQLIIQPTVCCTCPYFVWYINPYNKDFEEKKKIGQSLYKLLLKGAYCFGAGCVDLGVTDERECPMIHAKYYVHRPSGSWGFFKVPYGRQNMMLEHVETKTNTHIQRMQWYNYMSPKRLVNGLRGVKTDQKLIVYSLIRRLWKYHMSLVVRKPVFGVSDQVRHKTGCTDTEVG